MKLSHTLKLPAQQAYEMRYFYAEATEEDLPYNLRTSITPQEQWRILQYICIQQTTMSGVLTGLISAEQSKIVLQNAVNVLMVDGLYEKVKPYGLV